MGVKTEFTSLQEAGWLLVLFPKLIDA